MRTEVTERIDPSIFTIYGFKRQYPCIRRPLVCTRILRTLALYGDQYVTKEKVSQIIDIWLMRAENYLKILTRLGLVEQRKAARGYAYRLKPELLDSLKRCPRCGSPARPMGHRKPGQPNLWVCLSCGHLFKPKNGGREG